MSIKNWPLCNQASTPVPSLVCIVIRLQWQVIYFNYYIFICLYDDAPLVAEALGNCPTAAPPLGMEAFYESTR